MKQIFLFLCVALFVLSCSNSDNSSSSASDLDEETIYSTVKFDVNVDEIGNSYSTLSIQYTLIGDEALSFDAQKIGILISEYESLSPNAIYTLNLTYRFTISELNPQTTYYYKIFIEDQFGNRLFSDAFNFTTLSAIALEPQSSVEVFLSDLSFYTYPDEDLWIIQDTTLVSTSVSTTFGGMRSAVNQVEDEGRYVWLEFQNLESMPKTDSFNPFYVLSNIISISMPKATFIGAGTFRLCSDLASVSLPAAQEIEYGAFMQCNSLVDIELNSDYYVLDGGVVYNSDKSTIHTYLYGNAAADYTAPGSVTSVMQSAFYNTKITSLVLPNVKTLEYAAISTCSDLTTVSLPEVEELAQYALYNCSSLNSISAPKVKNIGKYAFADCESSCVITLATESEIESIAALSDESQAFYKVTLVIGSQNAKWVDENYLMASDSVMYRFKEIIIE